MRDGFEWHNAVAREVCSDVLFRNQKDGLYIVEETCEEQSKKSHPGETRNLHLPIRKNKILNVRHGTIIVPNSKETGNTEFSNSGKK